MAKTIRFKILNNGPIFDSISNGKILYTGLKHIKVTICWVYLLSLFVITRS